MKQDYYVYEYIDPRYNAPFYVGKGRANRAAHLKGHMNHNKLLKNKLIKLQREGFTVNDIVKYTHLNLTEERAFEIEKEQIIHYGKLIDGGVLLNVNDGGKQPPSRKGVKSPKTDEQKRKLKKSWTEERRRKHSEKMKHRDVSGWHHKIAASNKKFKFNQEEFEDLVRQGLKLKDIKGYYNITNDIIYSRLLEVYGTTKFRTIRRQILS